MIINVLSYLEDSARRLPEKNAFVDEAHHITFGDLQEQAQSLGTQIAFDLGYAIRKPVVVFVDRRLESIVTFLGVAYSGNFYVPIDKEMPLARINLILQTLQPQAMVVTPGNEDLSANLDQGIKRIDFKRG